MNKGEKMGTIHRNPTEESFIIWLSNFPESFHPLDMQRFYTFAKNVNTYGAKRWFNKKYFKSQIRLHIPNFDEDKIDCFYERLLICREYYNSFKTPLIDINAGEWRERKVINHKIVDVTINDIHQYSCKKNKQIKN
jgi:hypothetical protein